ncbi:hypothetical protein JCM10212_007164 [Sporobolomyces blumeae]
MENYYAGNPLNRLSYLRSSPAFLTSALRSPKSTFLVLDRLQPLCTPLDPTSNRREFVRVSWDVVRPYVGDPDKAFVGVDGKNDARDVPHLDVVGPMRRPDRDETTVGDLDAGETRRYFLEKPALVFLGVDERSAPAAAKSLPVSKPTDGSTLESHSPHGTPYWALDISNLPELKARLEDEDPAREFVELRAGAKEIENHEASIGAEARSLIDWNTRNKFCPGCARPLRSIWAGWKRACIPGEPADAAVEEGGEGPPTCVSKKGVHNYSYPRTDPVVIMAVLSPDREQILLGRQRSWPSKFYSCLAGFIESGESLEEAVRREVYEEAGVVVDQVGYHSSQPWPYPSSLMFGCWGIVKEGSSIRIDLDNELEDARFFTKDQVLQVIRSSESTQLTRDEVKKIDDAAQKNAGQHADKAREGGKASDEGLFRMPPATAIANTLVTAWANGTLFEPLANPNQPTTEGASGKL